MASAQKKSVAIAYLVVILAVNAYICRNLFFSEYTGHMNSIQGLWISMARLAGEHWYRPAWWPFQDGGMPFEHTYMPLVPAATALYAKIAHCSASRAFNAITGIVYTLGPVTLFLMAWRMTQAPGYSFWAALAYSLTSPARALIKDPYFNPAFLWTSRRLYTTVVWDDVPHGAAVCFLPLAFLFLWMSLEKRRPLYYLLAGIFIALAVLASVFAGMAILMGAFCLLWVLPRERLASNLRLAAAIGGVSYLAICPYLPPSLIETMRANQQMYPEDQWSLRSLAALGILAAAWIVLWLPLRRWSRDRSLQFFLLFALLASAIPLLDAYANLHFLPQAGRYQPEMELALGLAAVFAIRPLTKKLPWILNAALCLVLLFVAERQIVSHRRYAKEITSAVDMTAYIEYRVAKWVDGHMPGRRVMVAGSMAQWFNVFSDAPQLSGGSYSITPNLHQQEAMVGILTGSGPREAAVSLLWLKAFGIQAVAVCGPKSTEFWKPYTDPKKFDQLLPVLWHEDDVTIYRVPERTASLAHVIPQTAIAQNSSVPELEKFVAALEDPSLPVAEMRWDGFRRVLIRATAHQDQVVSVQTTYHRGWHARTGGRLVDIHRDGLGFLLIRPRCEGPCDIELTYDGGWEYKACRSVSALTILVLAGWWLFRAKAKRKPRSPVGGAA